MQSVQMISIVFQDGEPVDFTHTPEMMALVERAEKYDPLVTAAKKLVEAERYALYPSYKVRRETIDNALIELAALLPDPAEMEKK